jgi:DNA-binding transcriptional LysR family regulator
LADTKIEVETTIELAAGFPWAMPTPAAGLLRDLPFPFAEALATGRFPHYRLETTATCLDVVRDGHAVTLVPRSLAIDACMDGTLTYRTVPEFLRTNDGIHLLRNRTRSPSTRILIEALQEVATSIASPA